MPVLAYLAIFAQIACECLVIVASVTSKEPIQETVIGLVKAVPHKMQIPGLREILAHTIFFGKIMNLPIHEIVPKGGFLRMNEISNKHWGAINDKTSLITLSHGLDIGATRHPFTVIRLRLHKNPVSLMMI